MAKAKTNLHESSTHTKVFQWKNDEDFTNVSKHVKTNGISIFLTYPLGIASSSSPGEVRVRQPEIANLGDIFHGYVWCKWLCESYMIFFDHMMVLYDDMFILYLFQFISYHLWYFFFWIMIKQVKQRLNGDWSNKYRLEWDRKQGGKVIQWIITTSAHMRNHPQPRYDNSLQQPLLSPISLLHLGSPWRGHSIPTNKKQTQEGHSSGMGSEPSLFSLYMMHEIKITMIIGLYDMWWYYMIVFNHVWSTMTRSRVLWRCPEIGVPPKSSILIELSMK